MASYPYGDSIIRPRRALHSRAWQFTAFGNPSMPTGQMATTVHPANVQRHQHLYSGSDGTAIKYPICVIHENIGTDKKPTDHTEKNSDSDNGCVKCGWKAYDALDEYFLSSTLHGLKYVGDNSLSAFERLYWLAAFIAGLCFAAYFIASIYAKFETSPMVISFSPKQVYLNEIPFPALTICNVNLALRSKAIDIEKNGDAVQKELLADLCNSQLGNDASIHALKNATDWKTVEAFTIAVNQKCDDLVKVCKWNGMVKVCDEIINSILTDDGYCCAFNQLPMNMTLRGNFSDKGNYPEKVINWNAEEGYGEADNETYPFRATGQGQALGLTLVLDAQLDEYHCTSINSIGFKLLLSAPNERPRVAEVGFLLAPGEETRVTVFPDVKDATEGVRSIHIDKRQCFFAKERRLMYFMVYTEKNCRLECMANYTVKTCECVPYYLPRNPDDQICDRSKEECIEQAKSMIDRFTPERRECRCLPSCHDIAYKSDTMSTATIEAKYDTVDSDLLQNVSTKYFSLKYFRENMAIAHFYFELDKYTKQTKSEMYGFSEFLSNTGGLLGLFLGFSFLSAVEIIYFILFRWPFRYYRRYKAQRLKARQEGTRWANNIPYMQ